MKDNQKDAAMFCRVKRYAAVLAAAVVLTGAAGLGTASAASAATASRAPASHCHGAIVMRCTCPRGWQVTWPPWWEFWKRAEPPTCTRKR